jgi:hypothetical protein
MVPQDVVHDEFVGIGVEEGSLKGRPLSFLRKFWARAGGQAATRSSSASSTNVKLSIAT